MHLSVSIMFFKINTTHLGQLATDCTNYNKYIVILNNDCTCIRFKCVYECLYDI